MNKIKKNKYPNGIEEYSCITKSKFGIVFFNYGARIKNIFIPNKNGKIIDLTIEYEDIESYLEDDIYVNSIVGRTAGRINPTNFSFNKKEIKLSQNENKTNLLGGFKGLDNKFFKCKINEDNINETKVIFTTTLKNNEDGFPGDLEVKITYTIADNYLSILYEAISNETTLCNLTNHLYLNLNGVHTKGIENHLYFPNAKYYLETNDHVLPMINKKMNVNEVLNYTLKGWREKRLFDNQFILKENDKGIEIKGLESGVSVKILTTYPGNVLYTHNYASKNKFKHHHIDDINLGFVIETQFLSNDIHLEKNPKSILKKNEKYSEETKYFFSIESENK